MRICNALVVSGNHRLGLRHLRASVLFVLVVLCLTFVVAAAVVVDDEAVILESWRETLGDTYEVTLFSDALTSKRHFDAHEVVGEAADAEVLAMPDPQARRLGPDGSPAAARLEGR